MRYFVFLLLFVSCTVQPRQKVLFVGNSITFHGESPSIGWYGNWGMAATSQATDYVHILSRKLNADFHILPVSHWEWDFNDTTGFAQARDYNADILIFRLGENVSDTENYLDALNEMIIYFITAHTKQVIVTNNFWNDAVKDSIQQIIGQSYTFVDISSLDKDSANHAYGQYEHPGICAHPSDIGMANIAKLIYDKIK
jgi:hypothetical protein